MIAAPASAAASASATISSALIGMPGCFERDHGPFSAASSQVPLPFIIGAMLTWRAARRRR